MAPRSLRRWQPGLPPHAFFCEAAKSGVEHVLEKCVELGRWGGRAVGASLLEFSCATEIDTCPQQKTAVVDVP